MIKNDIKEIYTNQNKNDKLEDIYKTLSISCSLANGMVWKEKTKSFYKTIAREIYGADDVIFTKKAKTNIKKLTDLGLDKLPICIAKTQYSLSDDPTLLGRPIGFNIEINDLIPNTGSGFLVAISGDIMRMPGLPKVPAANNMDILENGEIIGLF